MPCAKAVKQLTACIWAASAEDRRARIPAHLLSRRMHGGGALGAEHCGYEAVKGGGPCRYENSNQAEQHRQRQISPGANPGVLFYLSPY